jgi:hypothetical protein
VLLVRGPMSAIADRNGRVVERDLPNYRYSYRFSLPIFSYRFSLDALLMHGWVAFIAGQDTTSVMGQQTNVCNCRTKTEG